MNKNVSEIIKSIPMKNVTLFMGLLVLGVLFLGREGIANRFSGQNLAQVAGSTYPSDTSYNLRITTSGPGTVQLSTGANVGMNTTRTYTFQKGTTVILNANRGRTGYFQKWDGGPCSGSTSPSCSVTMSSNKTAKAIFKSTERICSRESLDEATERVMNNNNLTPEQRTQQLNDLDDSILYFGCTW